MGGESTITIPGTSVKVPKWAPLAFVGALAAILILKPKSGEQGDFNEEGTVEEEQGAGLAELLDYLLNQDQGLDAPGPVDVGRSVRRDGSGSAEEPAYPSAPVTLGNPSRPIVAKAYSPTRLFDEASYGAAPSVAPVRTVATSSPTPVRVGYVSSSTLAQGVFDPSSGRVVSQSTRTTPQTQPGVTPQLAIYARSLRGAPSPYSYASYGGEPTIVNQATRTNITKAR